MKFPRFTLLAAWLALALAALPTLRAQSETPPAPPVPPAEEPAPKPAPPLEEEEQAAPPAEEVDPMSEPELPADESPEEKADEKASAQSEEIESADKEDDLRELGEPTKEKSSGKRTIRTRTRRGGDVEPKLGDQTVGRDSIQTEAVTIVGNTVVDGHVRDVAVSIVGNTIVNGRVDGEAVSIMGSTTVNGKVGGEAVAIFGDIILGKDAVVGGEAVAIFGKVIRGEGSHVGGGVQQIGGFGHFGDFAWLRAWLEKCLRWGRPLWFGENLGWAWAVAGGFLLFYMLLALIFPRGIERCAEVLEQQPGSTILAALLTALLTPVLIILLTITGVGIALLPFIGAALFFGGLFGKAAVFGWFGRRVIPTDASPRMRHAVVAVFVGGLMVTALYLVPFLGLLVWKLLKVLGVGMVVYALIVASNRSRPVRTVAVPVPPTTPGVATAAPYVAAPVQAPVFAPPPEAGQTEPLRDPSGAPVSPPPVASSYAPGTMSAPFLSASTLPRAGFWIRVAAALLDIVMIGILTGLMEGMFGFNFGSGFLLWLALYCVLMWTKKGTTIGGVICGLKLVRVDDRPLDWGVSIVRALAAFLSLAVAGLGFIWVAFDDEKQSWHDKIAGTTLVKVPKGTSLL